jgi:hypothetical protein
MHLRWIAGDLRRAALGAAFIVALMAPMDTGLAHAGDSCRKVVLEGDVSAGREWNASLGEGWVFRILPIPPGPSGYTGWDLAFDRDRPAGFPDALYLATPPYRSINEREIGTTYGLRAQDAIGWNPRSFHFLIDPGSFREAQQVYLSRRSVHEDASRADAQAMTRLLEMGEHAGEGELSILDARLVPGVADPAPYAQRWAAAGARVRHEIESSSGGASSARGALTWMRFRLTLWLPSNWNLPPNVRAARAACGH